jgi:serine/threonine-protein kinase
MADDRPCPRCGKPLPPDVLDANCPACQQANGLESGLKTSFRDDSNGSDPTFDIESTGPGQVLESLSQTLGAIPRVLLSDTMPDDQGVAVVIPSSTEMPSPDDRGARYQLFGEIARGGMGAILKGRDPDLGRDLAVKVLLDQHRDKPDLIRRFVEEAQIGGQLQHPGVIPVYALGRFGDGRPYFAMKLVKGRTLAALLAARAEPGSDRSRFLGIFEAVCQTVAYAHARGVIHRDLKPSNIMVGAFGEVQVMDWGLAKVLARGGAIDDERPRPEPLDLSVIRTIRSDSDSAPSQAGSVLGTPAYMPPEQASGDIERIDERADVFGLGSILCEILTGLPAYHGRTAPEVFRKAVGGDTADAMARLDACEADSEMVDLVKRCLAFEPQERPPHAGALAEAMVAYQAGVVVRLRAAELAQVEAEAKAQRERDRAVAERRAKRLTATLSMVLTTSVIGGAWAWITSDRAARARAVAANFEEAAREALQLQAEAHKAPPGDEAPWSLALAAAERAKDAVGPAGDPKLWQRALVMIDKIRTGQRQSELEANEAAKDKAMLDLLENIRSSGDEDEGGMFVETAYNVAFHDYGIDLGTLEPAEGARRIRERPPSVARRLTAGIDFWSRWRGDKRKDEDGARRLAEVARAADPDNGRNQFRDAYEKKDPNERRSALRALVKAARLTGPTGEPASPGAALTAHTLAAAAAALNALGDGESALGLLRAQQRQFPGDAWVSHDLAYALSERGKNEEAIRYYTAAAALRPEMGHNLAHCLARAGQRDEAATLLADLTRLRPDDVRHYDCLGDILKEQGKPKDAAKAYEAAVAKAREAVKKRVESPHAHQLLGLALSHNGQKDEARLEYQKALRLNTANPQVLVDRAHTLLEHKQFGDAAEACRAALEFRPGQTDILLMLARAQVNLRQFDEAAKSLAGVGLPSGNDTALSNLALDYQFQNKPEEAIRLARELLHRHPDNFGYTDLLGGGLRLVGEFEESLEMIRSASRLASGPLFREYSPNAIGILLRLLGRHEEAIAEYREALRINPMSDVTNSNLAEALWEIGSRDEAIALLRKQLAVRPKSGVYRGQLGEFLFQQGQFGEGLAELKRYQEQNQGEIDRFNFGKYFIQQARESLSAKIRTYERTAALAPRLPAVLKGDDRPKDTEEALAFMTLCGHQGRHAAATRLGQEILARDPAKTDEFQRTSWAGEAARAAAGEGIDAPPDQPARAALRHQALEWLRADLDIAAKMIEERDSDAHRKARYQLGLTRYFFELASVRNEAALAKLPRAERDEWRKFWADLDALRARARTAAAAP